MDSDWIPAASTSVLIQFFSVPFPSLLLGFHLDSAWIPVFGGGLHRLGARWILVMVQLLQIHG